MQRRIDSHGIICFQFWHPDYFIFSFKLFDYTSISAGLFSLAVSLVGVKDRLPKIDTITKEQNSTGARKESIFNLFKFAFYSLVSLTEL